MPCRGTKQPSIDQQQEQEVARGLRQGDVDAWRTLYEAYAGPLWQAIARRMGSDVADVVQETFLAAARSAPRYPLRSEMLKRHPLRELSIDVKVHSAVPLVKVDSPTHATRNDQAVHSAHVEFTAQEYTPTRDFEVVVQIDGRGSPLVMIPHRRARDGYFMLLVTPPVSNGTWERQLVPDGEPLELLIVADTSASMDARGRAAQSELVASLLSALTPDDKFNLAACDVDCTWVFAEPAPADARSVAAARALLADRASLGWSDLDKAFASALGQCGPQTHVIYVGDGIVTGPDVDPVAFTKRLERLYQGGAGTFHAVTVTSSFEPVVMKAIASLGGGSLRHASGERTPQAVALELLGEISQPGIRDLEVQFRGLRVARVYPEPLPNLSAGSQQILLGRYLPEGRDQSGEVVLTGTRDGDGSTLTSRSEDTTSMLPGRSDYYFYGDAMGRKFDTDASGFEIGGPADAGFEDLGDLSVTTESWSVPMLSELPYMSQLMSRFNSLLEKRRYALAETIALDGAERFTTELRDRSESEYFGFSRLGGLAPVGGSVPTSQSLGTVALEWRGRSRLGPPQDPQWLSGLFPHLPSPPSKEQARQPPPPWPAPARALGESLLRIEQIAAVQGGLKIERQSQSFHPHWGDQTGQSRMLALASPTAWLIRSQTGGSQTTVQWCDGRERGIFSKAFQLGRLRSSTPEDLRAPPLGLSGYTLWSIERTYLGAAGRAPAG